MSVARALPDPPVSHLQVVPTRIHAHPVPPPTPTPADGEEPLDHAAMLRFVRRIHGMETAGYVKLAYRDPASPRRELRHANCSMANKRRWAVLPGQLAKHAAGCDLYVAIAIYNAPTVREWEEQRQCYTHHYRIAPMIAHCRWLIADLDGHPLSPLLPPPTLLVRTSAASQQAWWELAAPVDAQACARLNEWIAAACGMGHEATAATTVLRIPGSRNRKPARRGEIVRLVEERAAIYTPDDFVHLRPMEPPVVRILAPDVPPEGGASPLSTPTPVGPGDDTRPAAPLDLAGVDGEAVWAAVAGDLAARWLACAAGAAIARADGDPYDGESNRDQALIAVLAAHLTDDNELAAAFLATPRGARLVARKGEGDIARRLGRMIHKARTHLDAHPPVSGAAYIGLDGGVVARSADLGPGGVATAVVMASRAPTIYLSRRAIGKALGRSADYIGEQQATLREEPALFAIVGQRRQQPVYRMARTDGPLVRLPPAIIQVGLGMDAVAAFAVVAGREAAGEGAPDQGEIAALLGIPRQRANMAMGELEGGGHVAVAVGARGKKCYHVRC